MKEAYKPRNRYNTLYPEDKIKKIDEEQLLFHIEQMRKREEKRKLKKVDS